jgi:hypothetical protein
MGRGGGEHNIITGRGIEDFRKKKIKKHVVERTFDAR